MVCMVEVRWLISIVADESTRLKNIKKRMGTDSNDEAEKELHFRDEFLHKVGLDGVLLRKDIEVVNKGKPIGKIAFELNRLVEAHVLSLLS